MAGFTSLKTALLRGGELQFSSLAGKVVLVTNVASQ